MSHTRAALTALLCAQVWACTGEVDESGPRSQAPGFQVPGVPGPTGVGVPGAPHAPPPDDAAMQAADPALFDIALRHFPGQGTPGGAPRLFRLTRTQLDVTTRTLLPARYLDTPVRDAMPRDPLQTNYEYAENLSWNAANFTPYTTWVSQIVERVRTDPTGVVDCAAEGQSPACLDRVARAFLTRAFRGVTDETQLVRFSDFFVRSVTEVGIAQATADLVDLTLTSPSYVFRSEVRADATGRMLPAELLQAVTYTLADAPPEALALSYADAPSLVGTDAALASTVTTVLASPAAREKLLQFFLAWLEVKAPDEFTISETTFPEFTPAVATAAVEETRQFLAHQLAAVAPSLKPITQSTQSFVSDALAEIYDVDANGAGVLTELDPVERLGVFTQPAVLASHSGPTNTRLVKRGVFFTRKVMCLPLGAPPDGIDTTIPDTPGATERQRIESITSVQPCLGCHAFINPFGFMQESFDAIGRFRHTDEAGLPINPAVSVDFLDEGPQSTQTAVDALRGFTSSARFKQCFARQVFRFYLGRDETPDDDPVLRNLFFDFASADAQDLLAMLRILAGSPSATRRTEAP